MRERLLTRLFLRRFLDNDLVSPDADRHETLAVVSAILASTSLFVTVLIAMKYQLAPFTSPGRTSLLVLDDRFLYIAGSMLIMALVAVAAWDALALDARDASILGPLPIPRGTVVRAKLAAIALFAAGVVAILNVVPSVLRPWMMPARLPLGGLDGLILIAVHAIATVAAGAFGFLAVLVLRELLHLVLGTALFARVSTLVQAVLVVGLATLLLVLPSGHGGVARSWIAPEAAVAPMWVPPLWYVGLHEAIGGGVIDRLPRTGSPGRAETEATALYRSRRPAFDALARIAWLALGLAAAIAVSAYSWNSRRPAIGAVGRRTRTGGVRRRMATWMARAARRLLVRNPEAQAGFFFSLQALARSVPHRLVMSCAAALGIAGAAVGMGGISLRPLRDAAAIPLSVLAAQTVVIVALLVGFRHAVRVPAELRAHWIFHLAWSGDERPYLAGVKRAALIVLIAPALLALGPWHLLVLGPRVALVHFVGGALLALVVLEALCLGLRSLPFASSYVPTSVLRSAGPLYVVGLLLLIYALAWIERTMLLFGMRGSAIFMASLAIVAALLRAIDRRQRRDRLVPIDLDEPPPPVTQRLELSG